MEPFLLILLLLAVILLATWFALRRRKPNTAAAALLPEWAIFFNEKQWQVFLKILQDYFRARNIAVQIDGEEGVVRDDKGSVMGLPNIAQICAHNQQWQWKKIIAAHFDGLLKATEGMSAEKEQIQTYEQARRLLAVRIWPEETFETLPSNLLVYRTDLPGTITALVYDFPDSVRNVRPEEAQTWGRPEEELFTRAILNLKANYQPQLVQQKIGDDIEITVFTGQDLFVASHALRLSQYPQFSGKYGALVAVPHRHTMLCYPIKSLDVITAAKRLIPLVHYLVHQGPGSITTNIYWYHDGQFEVFPYTIEGNTLQVSPSDSFVQMLSAFG